MSQCPAITCSVLLLLATGACSRSEAAAPAPDTLVLELGGPNPLLADSLNQLGIPLQPARLVRVLPPPPAPAPQPAPETPGPVVPAPVPQDQTQAVPDPAPPPAVLEVRLQKGETLGDIAKQHLGSAQKWRLLAEFNGFDLANLHRLREGTVVRIPPLDRRE